MILTKTRLKVICNSGASIVECIGTLKKPWATLGDPISVTVKEAKTATGFTSVNRVRKGEVARALVVRCRKEVRRSDGTMVAFDDNACVLMSKDGTPIGNRIGGVIARECQDKKWLKVVALAPQIA